jgi:hypothetical protein
VSVQNRYNLADRASEDVLELTATSVTAASMEFDRAAFSSPQPNRP